METDPTKYIYTAPRNEAVSAVRIGNYHYEEFAPINLANGDSIEFTVRWNMDENAGRFYRPRIEEAPMQGEVYGVPLVPDMVEEVIEVPQEVMNAAVARLGTYEAVREAAEAAIQGYAANLQGQWEPLRPGEPMIMQGNADLRYNPQMPQVQVEQANGDVAPRFHVDPAAYQGIFQDVRREAWNLAKPAPMPKPKKKKPVSTYGWLEHID